MKHIFIINPASAANKPKDFLINEIESYKDRYDIDIYCTNKQGDATDYIKNYLNNYNEEVRFYACGGDGTINEVVNGVIGYENSSISCYPCGSGDDFVKSIGGKDKYLNIENLLNAKNQKIDVIKVNDLYCLNVCNFGFDAEVVKYAVELKGKVPQPYKSGIVKALLTSMQNDIKVEVDGKLLNKGRKLLLGNAANGGYEGGQYFCAPHYSINDGLIELCYIKTLSIFTFLKFVDYFEKGLHIDSPKLKKYVIYKQVKNMKVYSKKEFSICIDGELVIGKEFNVEIMPNFVNFGIVE